MADNKSQYQQIAEASALALMFPLSIGAGFLIGYGLDRVFGSWPWMSFCGAGFGIVGAFINLFRTAAKADVGPAQVKSEEGKK